MNTHEMQEEDVLPDVDNTHRSLLHIQVAGNPSAERLHQVAQMFQQAATDPKGAVITTPSDVTVFNVLIPADQAMVPIMVTGAVSPELIAQSAYAVKRSLWRAHGIGIGVWASLSEEEKTPLRQQIQAYLRSPNATPQQLHTQWMKQMVDAGWVYGPSLNVELKQDPGIVPYPGLADIRQTWDAILKALVESMRARLPAPTAQLRPTQLYLEAKQSFIDIEFAELQPGNVWRFTEAPEQLYVATSEPYLQYTESTTAWTVDCQRLTVQQEPAEQEQGNDEANTKISELPADDDRAGVIGDDTADDDSRPVD